MRERSKGVLVGKRDKDRETERLRDKRRERKKERKKERKERKKERGKVGSNGMNFTCMSLRRVTLSLEHHITQEGISKGNKSESESKHIMQLRNEYDVTA